MIKGVIIYDSNSGQEVYHHGRIEGIESFQLAGTIHAIRSVFKCDNLELKNELRGMTYNRFIVNIEDGKLKIVDTKGEHTNIQIHDDNRFTGVFSVADDVQSSETESLFRKVAQVESLWNSLGPKRADLKKRLDDILGYN